MHTCIPELDLLIAIPWTCQGIVPCKSEHVSARSREYHVLRVLVCPGPQFDFPINNTATVTRDCTLLYLNTSFPDFPR